MIVSKCLVLLRSHAAASPADHRHLSAYCSYLVTVQWNVPRVKSYLQRSTSFPRSYLGRTRFTPTIIAGAKHNLWSPGRQLPVLRTS